MPTSAPTEGEAVRRYQDQLLQIDREPLPPDAWVVLDQVTDTLTRIEEHTLRGSGIPRSLLDELDQRVAQLEQLLEPIQDATDADEVLERAHQDFALDLTEVELRAEHPRVQEPATDLRTERSRIPGTELIQGAVALRDLPPETRGPALQQFITGIQSVSREVGSVFSDPATYREVVTAVQGLPAEEKAQVLAALVDALEHQLTREWQPASVPDLTSQRVTAVRTILDELGTTVTDRTASPDARREGMQALLRLWEVANDQRSRGGMSDGGTGLTDQTHQAINVLMQHLSEGAPDQLTANLELLRNLVTVHVINAPILAVSTLEWQGAVQRLLNSARGVEDLQSILAQAGANANDPFAALAAGVLSERIGALNTQELGQILPHLHAAAQRHFEFTEPLRRLATRYLAEDPMAATEALARQAQPNDALYQLLQERIRQEVVELRPEPAPEDLQRLYALYQAVRDHPELQNRARDVLAEAMRRSPSTPAHRNALMELQNRTQDPAIANLAQSRINRLSLEDLSQQVETHARAIEMAWDTRMIADAPADDDLERHLQAIHGLMPDVRARAYLDVTLENSVRQLEERVGRTENTAWRTQVYRELGLLTAPTGINYLNLGEATEFENKLQRHLAELDSRLAAGRRAGYQNDNAMTTFRGELQNLMGPLTTRLRELRQRETEIRDLTTQAGLDAGGEACLRELLDTIPDTDRVRVLRTLREIAARGKLNADLIEQLSALLDPGRTPLHAAIAEPIGDNPPHPNRHDLFLQVLQDLAYPSTINQSQWGTCAATCVQISLALHDPVRYIQILRALASDNGDASTTPEGAPLVPGLRRPDRQDLYQPDALPPRDDGAVVGVGQRSLSVRLMSPALMNYASDNWYDSPSDRHDYPWYRLDLPNDHGGLFAFQQERLIEGVLGLQVDAISGDRDEIWYRLQAAERQGLVVQVGLRWGDGAHAVLFAGTDTDQATGRRYALLSNPWGQRHAMLLGDFIERLQTAICPREAQGPIPIPPTWRNFNQYTPLQDAHYMSAEEVLKGTPAFANLNEDQQNALREFTNTFQLSPQFVQDHLRPLLASGRFNDAVLQRLQSVAQQNTDRDARERALRQLISTI